MIYPDIRVKASGSRTAKLAVVGMAPAKWEIGAGRPFTGPSGKELDAALSTVRIRRDSVYVSNLCEFFIDDNDLYSVPRELMEMEKRRVWSELDAVRPNCLLILGGDTLDLLTARELRSRVAKTGKVAGKQQLYTIGSRKGITKWRGSTFEIESPSGRKQKCVAGMHPSNFVRGQWRWLPLFKYIDVPRAVTQSSFSEMKLTPRTAIVGPSFRTAREYLEELIHGKATHISIDYEGRQHITCLGAGASASEAICVPLSRVGSSKYWDLSEEIAIWKLWCELLQSGKPLIAQNAAYEWIKSWLYGIYPRRLGIDTMLAHHMLYPDWGGAEDEWTKSKRNPDYPGHGLALIVSQYTDIPFYKDDGRHWTPEMGEEVFWRYNTIDVMGAFEAGMKMHDELMSLGLWERYQESYCELLEHTLRMEWFGIAFDTARADDARTQSQAEIDTLLTWLSDELHMKCVAKAESKGKAPKGVFNLGSPKQLAAFFISRGYKPRMKYDKNAGKSKPTWDKDTLARIQIEHPDDNVLRTIVKINKTQDTIQKVLNVKLSPEGRIHTHFKLGGTNGTRWSSTESILGSGTNLQNPPRQGVGRNLYLPT